MRFAVHCVDSLHFFLNDIECVIVYKMPGFIDSEETLYRVGDRYFNKSVAEGDSLEELEIHDLGVFESEDAAIERWRECGNMHDDWGEAMIWMPNVPRDLQDVNGLDQFEHLKDGYYLRWDLAGADLVRVGYKPTVSDDDEDEEEYSGRCDLLRSKDRWVARPFGDEDLLETVFLGVMEEDSAVKAWLEATGVERWGPPTEDELASLSIPPAELY